MSVFLGTVENKVDRKGRVSVPAGFRAVLVNQGFSGIVAYPSLREDGGAIEGCGMEYMQRISASVGRLDLFSEEQESLAALIFASAHQLPWDSEGRVLLPQELIDHAGITDRIAFVGRGETFQMWEPARFAAHRQALIERARRERPSLRLDPQGGQGGAQ